MHLFIKEGTTKDDENRVLSGGLKGDRKLRSQVDLNEIQIPDSTLK